MFTSETDKLPPNWSDDDEWVEWVEKADSKHARPKIIYNIYLEELFEIMLKNWAGLAPGNEFKNLSFLFYDIMICIFDITSACILNQTNHIVEVNKSIPFQYLHSTVIGVK